MQKLIKLLSISALTALVVGLSGCRDDAQVASANTRKAADNFEINRRIVFYNGITDNYLLEIEGRCSFDLNIPAPHSPSFRSGSRGVSCWV